MSFDYQACFILEKAFSGATFMATLQSFGLEFNARSKEYSYESGRVKEGPGKPHDLTSFAADGSSARPSAVAQLRSEEFSFDFGFVSLPILAELGRRASVSAGWLVISDGDLERMGYALDDLGTDALQLMVGLYQALNATSMAVGMETSAMQFLKFFAGELPLPEVDEKIRVAINPPIVCAGYMLSNPATRELDIRGTHLLARYFVGLEDLFPT